MVDAVRPHPQEQSPFIEVIVDAYDMGCHPNGTDLRAIWDESGARIPAFATITMHQHCRATAPVALLPNRAPARTLTGVRRRKGPPPHRPGEAPGLQSNPSFHRLSSLKSVPFGCHPFYSFTLVPSAKLSRSAHCFASGSSKRRNAVTALTLRSTTVGSAWSMGGRACTDFQRPTSSPTRRASSAILSHSH